MYRRGKCVERDYAEAVKWYLMAADRTQGGNAHVQAHA
ncbi:MAG: SEL1-like repeat protein [Pseudomonadota bacterium]|nr:SEL1-like repeat protein [Pseudomonadota bacterium]